MVKYSDGFLDMESIHHIMYHVSYISYWSRLSIYILFKISIRIEFHFATGFKKKPTHTKSFINLSSLLKKMTWSFIAMLKSTTSFAFLSVLSIFFLFFLVYLLPISSLSHEFPSQTCASFVIWTCLGISPSV